MLHYLLCIPVSEESVASGSMPVDFPDFTRGQWMNRKPAFTLKDEYQWLSNFVLS